MTRLTIDPECFRAAAPLRPLTCLRVWNPGDQSVPVAPLTHGVDLPGGLVADAGRLSLLDASGLPLAAQFEPLAWWPDGSVRWMLMDTLVRNLQPGWTELPLLIDDRELPVPATTLLSPDARASDPCSMQEEQDGLRVCRGGASVRLAFPLVTHRGRRLQPRIEESVWETRGPVRWAVRMEGCFPGMSGLRFTARLHSYFPTGLLKLEVRIHNSRRARHRGGLWDLGDAGAVRFRSFDVEIVPCDAGSDPSVIWRAESGLPFQADHSGSVRLYQDSSGRPNWDSQNHVNADGRVPCRFRGYRVTASDGESAGLTAQPVFQLASEQQAVTVCLPDFWQQFPKTMESSDGRIRVGLFPKEWDDCFELQGGEQKTHTLWLSLEDHQAGDSDRVTAESSFTSAGILDWVANPPQVVLPREWHIETQALPAFTPEDCCANGVLAEYVTAAVSGDQSLLARRDVIDEYGWRNFGDVWADHEQAECGMHEPVISHYNNQFDVVFGALLQRARTGDPGWTELLDPLARHVIDIDIYHTDEDRLAYNGGLFWHTDHHRQAATCTHRTYSAASQRDGQAYGGGPSDEHLYTTGLLHWYWMTGNRDAHDAVRSLADWVIQADDGAGTVLGLIDDGPTGLASATAEADYHGPGRGAGNSVSALVDGWLLSADRRYLDHAEQLIRRVVHPRDDIESLNLLDVERRWSYTVFLSALSKYLDAKAEAGERDDTYWYAAASLAHYGRWMLDHELPYFDQREKLEFPTETWAAQDLRKANVMRLAAKYCREPDRRRLISRGEEIADRAWQDLAGFESRFSARSLALVLTEGARDCWLRQSPPEPVEVPEREFPSREPFVTQKERVRRTLRSPRAMLTCVRRAASPFRWPGFFRALVRHF